MKVMAMPPWLSFTTRMLLLLLVIGSASCTTFSVMFQPMPAKSMAAIRENKDGGVVFSCKDECHDQKDANKNKVLATLPWCERGAPYIVKADRSQLERMNNSSDLLPVYSVKSTPSAGCERSVQIFFLPNSQNPDATRDMDAVGYWDGLTVYSSLDAPFHFIAIPRPEAGGCLIEFTSLEVFVSEKKLAHDFYEECPLTRPFWGPTEGYLKGFCVITRVRFSMKLDSVNRRVRYPLYVLALGSFICAAIALFMPTCPVFIALGILDVMIAMIEFFLIVWVQKVSELLESRFQVPLPPRVLRACYAISSTDVAYHATGAPHGQLPLSCRVDPTGSAAYVPTL